ncbi:MAG: ArsA family ATPase [Armatimonadetes bacterium]|nr:ArsA family ATPase [Armatimonadota bacterium]
MTRLLVLAGKGGVGKSTVAAATALLAAEQGGRVLLASIDSAHNLGDLFQQPVGAVPVSVQPGLDVLEVDANRELTTNWSAVLDFVRQISANDPGVSELVAEECAVLPGLEEVFGLLRLHEILESESYDLVLLDAPPTGDLLKFLRLPEVLRWFMERCHPLDRTLTRRLRPVAEALHWPVPPDAALVEMDHWYHKVSAVGEWLMDPDRASARLVLTPDRVALSETRRAWAWTCLLGMNVDGIIVNRVLPDRELPEWLTAWRARQQEILSEAAHSFADLEVLQAELRAEEVLGVPALLAFGRALYGERDPAAVWAAAPPLRWAETPHEATLSLRLPFLRRDQFRLLTGRDGLTVVVGNQRRIVPLPASIHRRTLRGARYDAGWLHVSFGPRSE